MTNIQKTITWTVSFLCLFSGFLVFIYQDILHHLPSIYRPWLIFHGVFGEVFLILFGMSINGHILYFLKQKKKLKWGIVLLLSIMINIISILLLYYGGMDTRESAHKVHIFIGFAQFFSLACHAYFGRIYRGTPKPKYNY